MRHFVTFFLLLLCASVTSAQRRNCISPNGDEYICVLGFCLNGNDFRCNNKREGDACGVNGACVEKCDFLDVFNVCCECRNKRFCRVQVTDPNNLNVTVHAPDEGVESIGISVAQNMSVTIPSFVVGTFDPVIVTGSKLDPTLNARLELQVCTNPSGCRTCDPVMTLVTRDPGKPVVETFSRLPYAEHYVTVKNGDPGLKNVLVIVNGASFRVTGLTDGEEHTLDVSSAMLSGDENIIQLKAFGKPGASATVLVHD